MDIGKQQRVILVAPLETIEESELTHSVATEYVSSMASCENRTPPPTRDHRPTRRIGRTHESTPRDVAE